MENRWHQKEKIHKIKKYLLFIVILGIGFAMQMTCVFFTKKYILENNIQLVYFLFSWGITLGALIFGTKVAFGYGKEGWCIPREEKGQHLWMGLFGGFFLVTLFVLVARFFGALKLGSLHLQFGMLIMFFIGFVLQSSLEECLVRGILTAKIYERWGKQAALFVPSVIFGALHMANPGFTFFSMLNTVLVGIFFAQLLFWQKNLLLCCGVHAGWNFALAGIYGFPVSGIVLSPIGMKFQMLRPELLGGKYGPEASIITTAILAIAVISLAFIERKKIWIKK